MRGPGAGRSVPTPVTRPQFSGQFTASPQTLESFVESLCTPERRGQSPRQLRERVTAERAGRLLESVGRGREKIPDYREFAQLVR